jgi:Ca-activated chloride channel family protein
MANDLTTQVHSHRLGGPRRRHPVRVIVIVAVLLAGLLTAGFTYYTSRGCSGHDNAVVAVAPDIAPLVQQLDTAWAKTKPSVHGTCVSVTVEARDSALMATELGSSRWDAADNGPPPDVWVPASSVWARSAAANAQVARMLPAQQPSLARSPSVIAMPEAMATALGWPGKVAFDWPDIATASADPSWWKSRGQSFGRFIFSMTDPKTSTAGLLALMSVADANNDAAISATERTAIVSLKDAMHRYVGDTSDVTTQLAKATSSAAALAYSSAFPALERDVVAYNAQHPKEPLVAVYPTSGSYDADYPYLILANPPWGTRAGPVAANAFLAYASGPAGRALFESNGYRAADRGAGTTMTTANGVEPTIAPKARALPSPDSVASTMNSWTAITRQTNLLLVLDISGSMAEVVSGTKTRMDLAKAAAIAAVRQFDEKSSVGLWVFSSALDGTKDYKSLVPVGTLSDTMTDGKTRRQDLINAITQIQPSGDTGLYDTIAAAQQEVMDHYQQFATNFVVLLTDGMNDDPTGGISLAQLDSKLAAAQKSGKNVPVVTIGFGADADFATLAQISHDSGTISLSSQDGVDIDQVLLAGIFNTPTTAGP